MGERQEQEKRPDKVPGSDRQSAPDTATPAPDQDGSLKVHGDKLEKLIPKGGANG